MHIITEAYFIHLSVTFESQIPKNLLTASLSRLFYDEKKVHLVYPEKPDTNVRDYSYDLAFQVI